MLEHLPLLLADAAADPLAGWYGPLLTIAGTIIAGILSGIAWLFNTQRADAKERQQKADKDAEDRLKEAKEDRQKYLETLESMIASQKDQGEKQATAFDRQTATLETMATEVKSLAKSSEETRASIEENKRATATLAAEMKTWRDTWQPAPSPGKRPNQ